jgi:hypothetical protein
MRRSRRSSTPAVRSPNLYQYRAQSSDAEARDVADSIGKEMTREPTAYDSHPSPQQRMDWAQALAVEHDAQPDDDASIWALFDDRDEIERTMTAEVRARVRENHGIVIAGAEQA